MRGLFWFGGGAISVALWALIVGGLGWKGALVVIVGGLAVVLYAGVQGD